MARVKTFTNGGTLLPSDLNSIEDDYEAAASTYKHLRDKVIRLDAPAASAGSPYLFVDGTAGAGVQASGASAALAVFYLDPAWFTFSSANARTTYYRIQVVALTNVTAVGTVTLTTGLYSVTAAAGGAAAVTVTLAGSPVTGSTVVFTNPASSTQVQGNSGDFAAPAAGYFAVAVVVSAGAAASSSVALIANLQMRQV